MGFVLVRVEFAEVTTCYHLVAGKAVTRAEILSFLRVKKFLEQIGVELYCTFGHAWRAID